MIDESLIKQILKEYEHMWTDAKDDYALIQEDVYYYIYNLHTGELGGTEIEEVNEIIWQKMIAAGVKILDRFPDENE